VSWENCLAVANWECSKSGFFDILEEVGVDSFS
jgi:hypothetical protein